MCEADLPAKVSWANDPKVNESIAMLEPVTLEGTQLWFAAHQADPDILLLTITLADQPIGFVKLGRHRGSNEGEYHGLVIGETSLWGRGLGKQVVRQILCHAFTVEGWDRLFGRWPAWNKRSIHLHLALGFVVEGTTGERRRYLDGTEHDVLLMSIGRDDWQRNTSAVP